MFQEAKKLLCGQLVQYASTASKALLSDASQQNPKTLSAQKHLITRPARLVLCWHRVYILHTKAVVCLTVGVISTPDPLSPSSLLHCRSFYLCPRWRYRGSTGGLTLITPVMSGTHSRVERFVQNLWPLHWLASDISHSLYVSFPLVK